MRLKVDWCNGVMLLDAMESEFETRRFVRPRNLLGFWLLGLTNNFAYVVMLSAAHDILKDNQGNETGINITSPLTDDSKNHSSPLIPDCNKIGTGAILLADILPTLVVKLTAPFYMHLIPYSIKVIAIILFGGVSFPIVALSHRTWLSVLGVVCASIGAGLGEITFLSLSSYFDKNVVSTWSSGTGAAGVLGALSYAGLTAIGVGPRDTLLIMLVIPVLMALSYFVMLAKPVKPIITESTPFIVPANGDETTEEMETSSQSAVFEEGDGEGDEGPPRKLRDKLILVLPLLKYMVPLGLVYMAEYFINQALFELVIFQHIWLPKQQQYRWYQVIYQIGVFISRSSVNLFQIHRLWLLPILQFINIAFLVCQIFFGFMPSIWLIFIFIIWEGLLGGCAYVNTFYKISQEVDEKDLEFSMGVASVADSTGIAIAGVLSVPVHNLFCDLKV